MTYEEYEIIERAQSIINEVQSMLSDLRDNENVYDAWNMLYEADGYLHDELREGVEDGD